MNNNTKHKHNKKRNIGIIYELLLRHMSSAVIEGNKKAMKTATNLIEKRFNKNTELYKEFRLFNAIANTTTTKTEIAAAILRESKQSCRNIDIKKLNKEKSDLIRDINYKIVPSDENFYYRSIPNYINLANIQLAINEWKKLDTSNLKKLIEIEEKIINFLSQEKISINYDQEHSLLQESKANKLVYKIMTEKINNKYKDMCPDQKKILQAYALGTKDHDSLTKILFENKQKCIDKIEKFQLLNENKYLSKNINEVKNKISSLNPDDINDKSIIKFLTVTKLINQLED